MQSRPYLDNRYYQNTHVITVYTKNEISYILVKLLYDNIDFIMYISNVTMVLWEGSFVMLPNKWAGICPDRGKFSVPYVFFNCFLT